MHNLHNAFGRPLDDLDILKSRISAVQHVGAVRSYTLFAATGECLAGFVADSDPQHPQGFTLAQFRSAA
jgi:hypothetical protein